MTRAEQVRQALASMAGQHGPAATAIGQVTAVNEVALTCTVDDGEGLPWYEVRLMPLLQVQQGMLLVPKVGAWCLLQRIEGGEDWCLVWASELQAWKLQADEVAVEAEDVLLQAATTQMQVLPAGLRLSKGGDGLKEILTDLITEILAIAAAKNVGAITAIQVRVAALLQGA